MTFKDAGLRVKHGMTTSSWFLTFNSLFPCRAMQKARGFLRGLSEGFSPSSVAARLFEQHMKAEGYGIGMSFTLVTFRKD